MNKKEYEKNTQVELAALPSYVGEFYLNKNLSMTTSYQYLTEIRRFFTWLRKEGISEASSNKSMPLKTLEHLSRSDVMLYISFLQHSTNRQGKTNSNSSINRSINALRSLFHYLTVIADSKNGEPYFYRNVMAKIPLLNDSETLNYRAHQLQSHMLVGDEKHKFIKYLEEDYADTLNKRGKSWYKKNKERNIAMIALMLATGVRISEICNMNIDDLHLVKQPMVDVIRKGGQRDSVPMAKWAVKYIQDYLEIRSSRYKPGKSEKALFLTVHSGTRRINDNQVRVFVNKYSSAFGTSLTPHKLRHTFASELYGVTKDEVLVAQQLGQRGTSATALYTHVDQSKLNDAVNKTN